MPQEHRWADPEADQTYCVNCGKVRVFDYVSAKDRAVYHYVAPQQWKVGTRLRLVRFADEEFVPPGAVGTVTETVYVWGSLVTIVEWDEYGTLGVLPGVDKVEEAREEVA